MINTKSNGSRNSTWGGCRLTFPALDSLSGKKQKKRNFAQLRRAVKHQFKWAILVRTLYPERPSTISQHTRFNYGPVTRIKGASLRIQSQTTSPSSLTCSVVSQRGVPESSARLRLAVPLMWACAEGCSFLSLTGCCRSSEEEGEWSRGGWERRSSPTEKH